MTRHPVTSGAIVAIGHEGDTLEVEFQGGQVYRYRGVSEADKDALISAESIGRHFREHVLGKYEHTRVEAEADNDGARG